MLAGRAANAVARRVSHDALRLRFAAARHRSDVELLERAVPKATLSELLSRFRGPVEPSFFVDAEDGPRRAGALAGQLPGWRERAVADADRLCTGIVRLLGADAVTLSEGGGTHGHGLPWHDDVLNGFRFSPATFYKQISVPYGVADIKVPWELSRCQHLPTLGMAYTVTGDDRYAYSVAAQIDDWIAHNPRGYGVNWSCTMEVAIRAVNWLWAYRLVSRSPALDDAFALRLLASLVVHAHHIDRNVELYSSGVTTNHTLADYVGLLYLGLALPALEEARGWRERGLAGVLECMDSQIHEDGVGFENSIAYHRLALELLLGAYLLACRNNCELPDRFRFTLERMLEFVLHYTRPDGLAPLIGDSDDGRLQILSDYFHWDPRDHRYLLAVGAVMFERLDFAIAARGAPGGLEEVMWLLGQEDTVRLVELQAAASSAAAPGSRAFAASGRYVMRSRGHHMVVCADEVGTAGMGNHKHNDIFSFELSLAGVPVVVDRGSFVYTLDAAERDRFRGTASHSTIAVDGAEQNRLLGPFRVAGDARVTVSRWSSTAGYDYLDAEHDGFARLSLPVTHRRVFVFVKDPFVLLVLDYLAGEGRHNFESRVQFAPEVRLTETPTTGGARIGALLEAAGLVLAREGASALPPEAASDPLRYEVAGIGTLVLPLGAGSARAVEGWYAPRFGQRLRSPALMLTNSFEGACAFGYLIAVDGE